MNAIPKRTDMVPIPGAAGDGLTHEEFLAVNGIAPVPDNVKPSDRLMIVYEQAVRAVQACRTIEQAKYWNSKAEALAAWAKVYTDDRIMREARALKLHAYRQLGAIAVKPRVLREHGFSGTQAREMVRISRLEVETFRSYSEADRPPTPSYLDRQILRPNTDWADVAQRAGVFLQAVRTYDPKKLANGLTDRQDARAEEVFTEITEWIDKFFEEYWK